MGTRCVQIDSNSYGEEHRRGLARHRRRDRRATRRQTSPSHPHLAPASRRLPRAGHRTWPRGPLALASRKAMGEGFGPALSGRQDPYSGPDYRIGSSGPGPCPSVWRGRTGRAAPRRRSTSARSVAREPHTRPSRLRLKNNGGLHVDEGAFRATSIRSGLASPLCRR
jgi:hypothetical protein